MSATDRSPITKQAIRNHYDLATPFYRLLWGPHIHHGLWEADETPELAQRQLIERLASFADIEAGGRVLDVGCGMGGASMHLAKHLGSEIVGLTLSPVQRLWAQFGAWKKGVSRHVRFLRLDAEQAEFEPASFDTVWSVECTEHLFNKPAFFQRASGWLRPGGRVAMCAWLAADRPHGVDAARQVQAVCEGFLCPSLGTSADYLNWLTAAGLGEIRWEDWTPRVVRTWEICLKRIRRGGLHWLARCAGSNMHRFVAHFETILEAYRSGAMKYGCFAARKPAA